MSDLKMICLGDLPILSPEEIKALNEQRKREYGQMLENLCPSKDIQTLAKRLSKRKCPCDKCVYTFGDLCLFPHSDGFIEDLEIDPCYEGVLRFLVKDIGITADSGLVAELRSVVTELRDELDREHNAFIAVCKAAVTCAELVFSYSRCAPDMRESILESADRIRDIVQELAYEAITRKERNELSNQKSSDF